MLRYFNTSNTQISSDYNARPTQCGILSLITNNVLRDALLSLENDFASAREPYGFSYSNLEVLGGSFDKADSKLGSRIPCHSCLRLREPKFVPGSVPLRRIGDHHQYQIHTGRSSGVAFQSTPTRTCFHRQIQSRKFLDNLDKPSSNRWSFWKGKPPAAFTKQHWMLLCATCNRVSCTRETPAARRFLAELCNDCWRLTHTEWCEFNDMIEQRRMDLKEEIDRIEDRRKTLFSYQYWMHYIDVGGSLNDASRDDPPQLEQHVHGLEAPDWQYIRCDATTRLDRPPQTRNGKWGNKGIRGDDRRRI